MEELYSTLLPNGRVHCMTWSGTNLIAISVSEGIPDTVTENNERTKVSYLAVFDPDRPWIFHKVSESRSVVHQLEWSLDGSRLLALDQNNIIHIWRMTQQNINTWVCAQKQGPPSSPSEAVVHAAWLEYKPKVTINHNKQLWPEALEFQQFSPLIRMLTGNAFICIHSNGKVQVTSANLNYGSNRAETKLEGVAAKIILAKSFVTPNGLVLCAVAYEDGQLRVYSLSLSLSWGSKFKLSASLATGVPRTSPYPVDKISHLVMLPLPDGCTLHACYNGTELCQWSVKDITTSGSYQAKKEKVFHAPSPITSICASSLCLCSQDTAVENEIIVLDEMSGVQSEGRGWPVELLLVTTQAGDIIILNRDTFKELQKFQLNSQNDPLYPVPKKARLLTPPPSPTSPPVPLTICLSPNAGCAAIATDQFVHQLHLGSLLLGAKDATSPEVSRCSRLLSLSTVTQQSSWDLVAMLSRVQGMPGFLQRVLAHYQTDYQSNSDFLGELLKRHYFTTCSLIHSSSEEGLYTVLGYRNISRLHATTGLLGLSLMTDTSSSPSSSSSDLPESWAMESLSNVCSNNQSEESIETLSGQLETKEFLIQQSTAQQLQSHVHWLLELAIKLVSNLSSGNTTSLPEPSSLELLRQNLLLVYMWNKVLSNPIIPVADGALSLLFKVLTKYTQSPSIALPDEIISEISGNIPTDKHPNLLTLTKAAHLQGFMNGLVACKLPEVYRKDMSPGIRWGVQGNFTSMDPYSPLTLAVPRGLSPPWKDCFVEEQRDVIHGGVIMKNLIQNSRLKQCSRCRCWTVVPDNVQLVGGGGGGADVTGVTTHPVMQWRQNWSGSCLCGGPWTLHLQHTAPIVKST